MSREIKFRALNLDNNKMLYQDKDFGYISSRGVDLLPLDAVVKNRLQYTNRVILMQYTGLKDKNGKEIYEGDIVLIEDTYKERILDDGSGPIEPFNHLAPVVFEHTEFGVEIKQGADIFYSGFWSFAMIERETGQNEFEVIGNVYENYELLHAGS